MENKLYANMTVLLRNLKDPNRTPQQERDHALAVAKYETLHREFWAKQLNTGTDDPAVGAKVDAEIAEAEVMFKRLMEIKKTINEGGTHDYI